MGKKWRTRKNKNKRGKRHNKTTRNKHIQKGGIDTMTNADVYNNTYSENKIEENKMEDMPQPISESVTQETPEIFSETKTEIIEEPIETTTEDVNETPTEIIPESTTKETLTEVTTTEVIPEQEIEHKNEAHQELVDFLKSILGKYV